MSDPTRRSAVTVRIAGEEHTIRSAAEPDHTRECARFVDERIMEIRTRSGLIESHKAAILAALSITDEFLQAQGELEVLRREVASRVTNLTRRLESQLREDAEDGAVEDSEGD